MRILRFHALFLLLLTALAAPAQAAPPAADQLVARIQKLYDTAGSYQADFAQTSTLKTTGQKTEASGKVVFKKPGKMRWIYEKPIDQELISDGKTLWIVQPDDKQAVRSDAEKYLKNRASITFLAGKGRLTDEFTVALGAAPAGAGEGTPLVLTPKQPDPTVSKVVLIADAKTGAVRETWVYDFLGNVTRVQFQNPVHGKKVDEKQFSYTPPKGFDVIEQNF